MEECWICKKIFSTRSNLNRHLKIIHSNESDDVSDAGCESGEDEINDATMNMDDEVEVLGLILKEVISEQQDKESEEINDISSVDDMLHKDNYIKIVEGFREKVLVFLNICTMQLMYM